jgi:hypothetical protein
MQVVFPKIGAKGTLVAFAGFTAVVFEVVVIAVEFVYKELVFDGATVILEGTTVVVVVFELVVAAVLIAETAPIHAVATLSVSDLSLEYPKMQRDCVSKDWVKRSCPHPGITRFVSLYHAATDRQA